MTSPNIPTRSDINEARERVIAKTHPAHAKDIRAGKWDRYGAVQAELSEMIREQAEGDQE